MTIENEKLLDETGWQILAALQAQARLTYAELGRRLGLTAPAVAERVHRLEEAGIIRGYRTDLNPSALGYNIMAIISVTTPAASYPAFIALMKELPSIVECHHITGQASFILKALVPSVGELEKLIARFSSFGPTSTSIVLSTKIDRQPPVRQP